MSSAVPSSVPAAVPTGGDHVADVVAPPEGHPRFPLIDAVRALASLTIVLVHVAVVCEGVLSDAPYRRIVSHLDIGVSLFFVLSGFLLYRPFLASRVVGAPKTRILDYARRRVLRIAPAYWLALTVLAIVPGLYGVFSSNWWVYYGLLQNYPVYTRDADCAAHIYECGIAVTWTLSIEVAFYAALPFFAVAMAFVTRRLVGGRGWVGVELLVLAVIAGVSFPIQSLTIPLNEWVFFSPLGRGWWFAIGMAFAVVSVWVQQRGAVPKAITWLAAHPGSLWTLAAVLYVVPSLTYWPSTPMAAFPLGNKTEYIVQYGMFGLIGICVVLPAVFGDVKQGWPRKFLAHRIPAWYGLTSYGIFLWHFPILYGLNEAGITDLLPSLAFPLLLVATLIVTTICAALSYYFVERPLMRWKRARPSRSDPQPPAATSAQPPVAASV